MTRIETIPTVDCVARHAMVSCGLRSGYAVANCDMVRELGITNVGAAVAGGGKGR